MIPAFFALVWLFLAISTAATGDPDWQTFFAIAVCMFFVGVGAITSAIKQKGKKK